MEPNALGIKIRKYDEILQIHELVKLPQENLRKENRRKGRNTRVKSRKMIQKNSPTGF